jgi:proline iminopeptidase
MKRRTGLLSMALVLSAGLALSLYAGAASNEGATTPEGPASPKQAQKRERAMDRVVYIEEGIIREIPAVPRLCDGLDLKKEKVDIGDCKLYCEQEGQGMPLVLLHGGPGATHHNFHPDFSRAKDFAHIIYYDQRGCGLSDYQPGGGYTVDQAVDDLDRLRRALGIDQWVVLGHSYGGLLAQCYAVKYPEKVQGLILLCASTGLHGESLPSRQNDFIGPEERQKMNQIRKESGLSIAQLVYNNHLNGDWKRQSYYKPTREQLAQTALYGWIHDFDRNFNGVMSRSSNAINLQGAFAQCPIPTLILEAKWDMSWNTDKPERLHKNHPNAKLIMFEASGHSPFEDEPEVFFPVLKEFLAALPPAPSEKIDPWKVALAQWRQDQKDPMLTAKMSPEEAQAIEEFRRIKARILAGESYEDTSTPLHAALSKFSQWKPGGSSRDYFMGLDILRAPLPPEKPAEGSVWPIFAGSSEVEDTFIVAYSKGQWIWLGNMGNGADWRPFKATAEKGAKQAIEKKAAKDNRPAIPDLSAPPAAGPPGVNRVLSLDGQTGFVRVPDSPSLHTFTNAITMEAWFKAASFPPQEGNISSLLRKNVTAGGENFLLRFRTIEGEPWVEASPGYDLGVARASHPFATGKWYHVAGVYDGAAVTIYVNGVKIGAESISGPMSIDNSDLFIGKGDPEFSSGEYFHGVLDEIRLWNVARSPQEIRAALTTPLTGKEPGLVAHWDFDSGTARDRTGHGNDGVLGPNVQTVADTTATPKPPGDGTK